MSKNTSIEWCDHTFNPWIGCTKVGMGCDNCYAEAMMDKRLHKVNWGAGQKRVRTSDENWKQPLKWNAESVKLGIRYRVFCSSLADVFDNEVDQQWRDDLWALIKSTPNLDWLLLTKRIGNANGMLPLPFDSERYLPNMWIGATVVNQSEADRDIPKLLNTQAAKRFLSIEPMLGPIQLTGIPISGHGHHEFDPIITANALKRPETDSTSVGWVIVGGESGPNARPMHPDWVRSLRDQCKAADVPFLFKQWGEWANLTNEPNGSVLHQKSRECRIFTPTNELLGSGTRLGGMVDDQWKERGGAWMGKTDKHIAGRLLDGVEHNEFPEVPL